MAIPTFVAAGSRGQGTGDVTPGLPAGVATDDILVLHIEGEGEDANADGPPTGGEWTAIDGASGSVASSEDSAVDRTRHSVYWHRYAGSDPNRTVPDAGDHCVAGITAWRGCITTASPIHKNQSSTNSTNSTTMSATGVTTTVADCLIVISGSCGDGITMSSWTNGSLASPAITEALDMNTNQGSDGAVHAAYGGLASAGASGTTTATISASEEQANWVFALEPAPPAPTVTDVETDEDYDDKDTALTITGTGFEATKGAGKVEMGDNSDYATANKVEQTTTSWSDTAIDFTAGLSTQSPGGKWIFVTNNSANKNDPGFAVTVHRANAFDMAASGNIAASGEATTFQLAAPSGKATTDFDAGRIQDDENPADTIDITADDYSEFEWCVAANTNANDVQYAFRVTKNGAALDTYTVTPKLTIPAAVVGQPRTLRNFGIPTAPTRPNVGGWN